MRGCSGIFLNLRQWPPDRLETAPSKHSTADKCPSKRQGSSLRNRTAGNLARVYGRRTTPAALASAAVAVSKPGPDVARMAAVHFRLKAVATSLSQLLTCLSTICRQLDMPPNTCNPSGQGAL
jgi:hypothetical protein